MVHWPARADLRTRGPHVILRKPVSPNGVDEHRARYLRGIQDGATIVVATIGRTIGTVFAVVDVQRAESGSAHATVEVELWDFPMRLMTARHRTVWWRLHDAAQHQGMRRILEQEP